MRFKTPEEKKAYYLGKVEGFNEAFEKLFPPFKIDEKVKK